MNWIVKLALVGGLLVGGCETTPPEGGGGIPGLKVEEVMRAPLEGTAEKEMIVSSVVIPPNTTLPVHWHPGEEFAYIVKGSARLWRPGEEAIVGKKGDVVKVPYRAVHTAITGPEGVELMIFRVHEKGRPERVVVEQ